MKIKVIDLLEEVCNEVYNTSVYENYSGRNMFGRECLGISCDNYIRVIEKAARKGLEGATYDQLGTGYIVYWPTFNKESEIDAVELREIEEE